MPEYTTLHHIRLSEHHQPTEVVRHYFGHQEVPPPAVLRIVTYPHAPGCYLLALDMCGNEVTGSYHDTVDDAMTQAASAFQVGHAEWDEALWEMPTSTISTRHGQMAYLSIGHGRPFVLLHGNTMTAASQEKLARRFIDEYRVVCVDLLGHGRSARPLHLFSRDYFRLQGEAVADLLTGLFANEQVIVFGMSAGGVAALNAACHCQDRIAALVIDSSFSYIGVETLIAHREGMEYLSPSWEHYLRNQHGHDWWPQLKTGLLDTIGQLAETMDSVTPCLAAIRAPTLIFQGGQDPFSHESQGREMAMTIPNAKLIYDPEAGHILSWRDPGRFRNTVREFLHEQLVLWS